MFGMKNGKLELVDSRSGKTYMGKLEPIHKNGINSLEVDPKNSLTYMTSGRDDTIKLFDLRYLKSSYIKQTECIKPLMVFNSHKSQDFSI